MQEMIVLHHFPSRATGASPNTCKLTESHHTPRSWWTGQQQSTARLWIEPRKHLELPGHRAGPWTDLQFCAQTPWPPLFSPASLTTALLYFGFSPIGKSTRPADGTQISAPWQPMMHSVPLHPGSSVGCSAAQSFWWFVSCLGHFPAGFDTALWTFPSAPPTQHTWINSDTWTDGFKNKKITPQEAVSPFPTMGRPSWSHEEIQDCCSFFLQPWLPGSCICSRMVRNGWLQATGTQIPVPTRTIISVHYQLQTAHWFFLCYLILSIPGPDPIKIPSSICITGTHPKP